MPFVSVNPATGRRLAVHRAHSRARVAAAVDRAQAAYLDWRGLTLARRARVIRAIARRLRAEQETLAQLLTAEVGKPIAQARAEVGKSAMVCDYYARHAARYLAPERPLGAPRGTRVVCEPLGLILAIMPWNFPFWQVFRAAAPALMAGNGFLLKPAPNTAGCALAIEKIFAEADAPRGLLTVLLAEVDAVPGLVADARIRGVTLTGSTRAGRSVAALAGAAMKPGVFELGGSDPYLVLHDADVAEAARICAHSRLINSGQSCIGAKRMIVVRSVLREFERELTARFAAARTGDPTDLATGVGPLARGDLRDTLHAQVRRSVARGAKLLLGGRPLPGPGNFYAPTVLTGVRPGMPAYDEELFGPVAAIIPVRDEAEALAVANDSSYGLGAAIFTRDRRRARRLAGQIEAGLVFVNDFVRSAPALPFGGVKQSGHGRELGAGGIRAFVNLKTLSGA
ncbi:MAG: NAD-dependent succinate-semialdehyde dehydrogenase [Verrucomicrobia bacterium]|nr:NAD-dependent succinate-semialdehyde dehydrogenase [Verrucomicrobiota bacterium]